MTPEAQQIAIAEACGWKDIHVYVGHLCGTPPNGKSVFLRSVGVVGEDYRNVLPDYLNDLNAMRDAEKVLKTSKLRDKYERHLRLVRADIEVWHANASERAEAFLRTIGEWVD